MMATKAKKKTAKKPPKKAAMKKGVRKNAMKGVRKTLIMKKGGGVRRAMAPVKAMKRR